MMIVSSNWVLGNQKLKLAFDDRLLNNKEDNNFNLDDIKKVVLFNTIKTDKNNNNEQNNSNIFIQFYIFNNNLFIIIREPNSLER